MFSLCLFFPVTLLISALNIIEVISLLIRFSSGQQSFISEYMKPFNKNSLKICDNKSFYFTVGILCAKDLPLIKPQNTLLKNNLKRSFNCELREYFSAVIVHAYKAANKVNHMCLKL